MKLRLRHLTNVGDGTRAVREELVDVESITIGRSSESVIYLPELVVALHHAVVHLQDKRLWVETVDGDAVRVNGRVASGRSLRANDVVRVGHHELRVVATGNDELADLTVDIDVVPALDAAFDKSPDQTRLGIEEGLFARRPLSWAALLIVLAAFLVAPLWAARSPNAVPYEPGDAQTEAWERWANLSWASGPVSSPHQHFADRCQTCHLAPFEPVPDETCARCHASEGPHVANHLWADAEQETPCSACHEEHRGDARLRAARESADCLSCHSTIEKDFPEAGLRNVGDFADGHPQFRLTVPGGEGARLLLKDPTGESRAQADASRFPMAPFGGLRFPHDVHLRPDLRGPEDLVSLSCESCHASDASGVTMQGMTFEARCESCHSLAFDTAEPSRAVAHRDPSLVRREVFEYYAARAARGEADLVVIAERRRPGREFLVDPNPATARWIAERVAAAEERLLGDGGVCGQCHELSGDLESLQVMPIEAGPFSGAARWLPNAVFSHQPHQAVSCNLCHAADAVSEAEKVMMPGIGVCRSCHAGSEPQVGRIRSSCESCHDYHPDGSAPGSSPPEEAMAEARS